MNKSATRPPLISACLIVRDEETNLRRCLDSLKGRVDDLVVVDTGSTDRTVDVARDYGARIFFFAWCDDFAAARNASLRHAAGAYILWLDADEELVERTPGALRQICTEGAPWGWFLDVHCPSEPDRPAAIVRQWRLIPNGAGIQFEGRIHEHPAAPRIIQASDVSVQEDVWIHHRGYIPSARQPLKMARNRRLIERSIIDEPRQPRHYFNLGMELVAEGADDAALAVLRQGISYWFQAHGPDTGYVPAMFSEAAAAANRLGQPQVVLDIERQVPPEFVSSEMLLQTGFACQQLGRVDEAKSRLMRAAFDRAAISNVFADRESPMKAEQALRAMSAASISACLIVKNEEANLPRCLASVRPAVDEIVVVDTGSTDRTVEIAQAYGARVFHFAWCDDFSAARNESLGHATGDFIIWIDADDELIEERPGALRQLCRELAPRSWGYWVDVHCPTDEWEEGNSVLKQSRVFRNHINVRFHGRLHEQAAPPPEIQAEPLSYQNDIHIKHWGYIAQGQVATRRAVRNSRILQQMIAAQPDEHFHYYNLALQYAGDRQFVRALATFEQAIELWTKHPGPNDGYVANMFSMAVLSAIELGEYEKALRLEERVPAEYLSADLLHHAAVAWWRLGHPHQALERFARVVADDSLIYPNVHDRSTSTWRPLLLMACIYSEQDQFDRAYEAAHRALDFAPTKPQILFVLAYAATRLGKTDEAIGLIRRLTAGDRDDGYKAQARRLQLNIANELDDPQLALEALSGEVENLGEAGAAFLRARAYGLAGDISKQYSELLEGCQRFPGDADLRLELSRFLENQGAADEALGVLAQALDYPPVRADIYRRLAGLLARQGKLADAANALELAEAEDRRQLSAAGGVTHAAA